jgi:hypothetical protein
MVEADKPTVALPRNTLAGMGLPASRSRKPSFKYTGDALALTHAVLPFLLPESN